MLDLTNSWDNNRWGVRELVDIDCEISPLDKSYSAVHRLLSALISSMSDPSSLLCLSPLLSWRCRNSHSCFSSTSKLWKSEEFEVKYVENTAYHYYYWQQVFIWSRSLHRQNCIPGHLHSQLVLIRTSQARSYLGQHYNKAYISYNFIIWG